MNRQQSFLSQAVKDVNGLLKNEESKKTQRIYGTLCHKFPVLIRTCGLCQTAAFIESKVSSDNNDRKQAHTSLGAHALKVLKDQGIVNPQKQKLSEAVGELDAMSYALATRILLRAWIYYKRFAESILGVKAGDEEDDNGPSA